MFDALQVRRAPGAPGPQAEPQMGGVTSHSYWLLQQPQLKTELRRIRTVVRIQNRNGDWILMDSDGFWWILMDSGFGFLESVYVYAKCERNVEAQESQEPSAWLSRSVLFWRQAWKIHPDQQFEFRVIQPDSWYTPVQCLNMEDMKGHVTLRIFIIFPPCSNVDSDWCGVRLGTPYGQASWKAIPLLRRGIAGVRKLLPAGDVRKASVKSMGISGS